MQFSLKELQKKINERVFRERVLIFASSVAVLYLIWNFLIQAAFENKKKEVEEQFATLSAQRTATQTKIVELNTTLLNNPDRVKEEQIKQIQDDINSVDTKLKSVSQGIINADQLPQVLQDVLQKTSKLTLLSVATLPTHELQIVSLDDAANKPAGDNKKPDARHVGVYEHVVELKLSGSYFQLVDFLTTLEALPWHFYWQRLDYQVTEYPNAEINLRVYTLSSEEGLLGV